MTPLTTRPAPAPRAWVPRRKRRASARVPAADAAPSGAGRAARRVGKVLGVLYVIGLLVAAQVGLFLGLARGLDEMNAQARAALAEAGGR